MEGSARHICGEVHSNLLIEITVLSAVKKQFLLQMLFAYV